MQIVGQENLDTALKEGKGVILASIHMGNGGFVTTSLALKGFPVNIVSLEGEKWKGEELLLGNLIIGTRLL